MESVFKETLVSKVEGQAKWRAERAEEWPEDQRNARSFQALSRLAEALNAIPDDHEIYRNLERLTDRLGGDGLLRLAEQGGEELLISRYGLDSSADDGSDPERFLRGLLGIYLEAVGNGPQSTDAGHA